MLDLDIKQNFVTKIMNEWMNEVGSHFVAQTGVQWLDHSSP